MGEGLLLNGPYRCQLLALIAPRHFLHVMYLILAFVSTESNPGKPAPTSRCESDMSLLPLKCHLLWLPDQSTCVSPYQ